MARPPLPAASPFWSAPLLGCSSPPLLPLDLLCLPGAGISKCLRNKLVYKGCGAGVRFPQPPDGLHCRVTAEGRQQTGVPTSTFTLIDRTGWSHLSSGLVASGGWPWWVAGGPLGMWAGVLSPPPLLPTSQHGSRRGGLPLLPHLHPILLRCSPLQRHDAEPEAAVLPLVQRGHGPGGPAPRQV